jgi:hypothetical protein
MSLLKKFLPIFITLIEMSQGLFPFTTITSICIEHVKQIIAPRYLLYPDTTVEAQIQATKKQYGL